ncbi:MAG: sugar isomerase, partial [Planctomycetota bacterium]
YRLGSLANTDPDVRRAASDHLAASAQLCSEVDADSVSLWFADGTNYPGQGNIRQRKRWFEEGLHALHAELPAGKSMLIEYKPFEPAFYHTDIADWGMAAAFARAAGERARVLVDTGHHLPGANIEHIVAFLIDEGLLGGFHFNDRKYADDDLTMGSIDPYQLFRILFEITQAEHDLGRELDIAYMIDQSHNLKPKVEAMVQTVCTAHEMFARALLVDHGALATARERGDIIASERCLRSAFETDVRPMMREYREARGLPADPIDAHRQSGYTERMARERSPRKPRSDGGYA